MSLRWFKEYKNFCIKQLELGRDLYPDEERKYTEIINHIEHIYKSALQGLVTAHEAMYEIARVMK